MSLVDISDEIRLERFGASAKQIFYKDVLVGTIVWGCPDDKMIENDMFSYRTDENTGEELNGRKVNRLYFYVDTEKWDKWEKQQAQLKQEKIKLMKKIG